jgi:hypothetical protein
MLLEALAALGYASAVPRVAALTARNELYAQYRDWRGLFHHYFRRCFLSHYFIIPLVLPFMQQPSPRLTMPPLAIFLAGPPQAIFS